MKLNEAKTTPMSSMDEPIGETTEDAFHKDAFRVVQPKHTGHRSGLDALLRLSRKMPPVSWQILVREPALLVLQR